MDARAELKCCMKCILPILGVLVAFIVFAAPAATAPSTVQALHGSRVPVKEGMSGNWAGYVVVTDLKTPQSYAVSDVKGQWVVPSVSSSTSNTYSAVWVGIDGYSSNTVEQIGTEQDSINGQPTYYAWFEMYPSLSHLINNPVSPGDTMMAEVKYIGNGYFQLILNDKSFNSTIHSDWNFSITRQAANTLGQSAEWIVEAPLSVSGELLPLANFGSVDFSGAQATLNGHAGTINDNAWHKDAITIVTSDGTAKAQPSVLSSDGSSFSIRTTVTPPPIITVVSPNGGENWMMGTTQTITWTSDGAIGQVRIDLSRDGGTTWRTIIYGTANDGNQAWRVTGPATTEAMIRVISVTNQDVLDISDANFTIIPPTITVVSPNGGENWMMGTTQTITWTSDGVIGQVRIDLSRDGGTTWRTIIYGTTNDGDQAWRVTGPATTETMIRVVSVTNQAVLDISDANFTITLP